MKSPAFRGRHHHHQDHARRSSCWWQRTGRDGKDGKEFCIQKSSRFKLILHTFRELDPWFVFSLSMASPLPFLLNSIRGEPRFFYSPNKSSRIRMIWNQLSHLCMSHKCLPSSWHRGNQRIYQLTKKQQFIKRPDKKFSGLCIRTGMTIIMMSIVCHKEIWLVWSRGNRNRIKENNHHIKTNDGDQFSMQSSGSQAERKGIDFFLQKKAGIRSSDLRKVALSNSLIRSQISLDDFSGN